MSSPMWEIPDHVPIGIDALGRGPVDETDPRYERTVCWCGDEGCQLYRAVQVAQILHDHRAVGRGWFDTVWHCAAGCIVGVREPGLTRGDKERAHQAAKIAEAW